MAKVMADPLAEDGKAAPELLISLLEDALPEDYIVVANPHAHRRAPDAIVVGPQGVFVVYIEGRRREGGAWRVRRKSWLKRRLSGGAIPSSNLAEEARSVAHELRSFLRERFPALRPPIYHMVVLSQSDVERQNHQEAGFHFVTMDTLAEAVTSMKPSYEPTLSDRHLREALATALRDRPWMPRRASEPFIFRSGGLLGSGKKVWDVRAAIRHMDRHPEDGIYHLRNGTLARWLDEQGARHLAELARDVVRQRETDPRILLETFLIGTGLVPRPRLSIKPRQLDFGYLLSGQTGTATLRVCKGRGRGYLFGVLQTSVPWLRVEPRTFSGQPLEALVRVNTEALPIRERPHEARIYVESSASEDPIEIPVRLRVVGRPSPLNRYLFRPLAGLVSAGVLGVILGWLGSLWTRSNPSAIGSSQLASGYIWSALIGGVWAILGGIRGGFQTPAWPILYATRHWLRRVLIWMLIFFSLTGVTLLAWERSHPGLNAYTVNTVRGGAWFFASFLTAVFAALGGIWRGSAWRRRGRITRRLWLRWALLILCGALLGGTLAFGARSFGPTWQQLDAARWITSARIQAEDQWIRFESEVNTLIDRVYLLYYDRRAPAQPVVEPSPQATRPAEGEAP